MKELKTTLIKNRFTMNKTTDKSGVSLP